MRQWTYLVNPFISATEGSFRTMKKIGDYTFFALENKIPPPAFAGGGSPGDPLPPDEVALYTDLRNELLPLITNYNNKYDAWLASYADRKGQTTRLVDLLEQLRGEKIQEWDVNIQTVYNSKSAEYQRLLPRKRRPFQTGPYQSRLDALRLLSNQISTDTNFDTAFKNSISDFYVELFNEIRNQANEKSDTGFASSSLEPARKALAKGLYSALGKMIWYFAGDTDIITNFFDLEAIRDSQQTTFRHFIKPEEMITAVHRTLTENTVVRLQNDGGTELKFWLAENAADGPGETFVTVAKHTEKLVTPAQLGGVSGKFLNVFNTNVDISGHYIVTIQ